MVISAVGRDEGHAMRALKTSGYRSDVAGVKIQLAHKPLGDTC